MGYKKSSIYAWVKEGKFPAPRVTSGHKNLWLESDVDRWIAERIAA